MAPHCFAVHIVQKSNRKADFRQAFFLSKYPING